MYVTVSLRQVTFSNLMPSEYVWTSCILGDQYVLEQNYLFKLSGLQIRFQLSTEVHCVSIFIEKSMSKNLD